MSDTVWLELEKGKISVAVDRQEALTWTAKDFAKLYRRSVYGVSRREAREWGRRQVEIRDDSLAAAAFARALP